MVAVAGEGLVVEAGRLIWIPMYVCWVGLGSLHGFFFFFYPLFFNLDRVFWVGSFLARGPCCWTASFQHPAASMCHDIQGPQDVHAQDAIAGQGAV